MQGEIEVEYPRMVYHPAKGHTVVRDEAQHLAHLGDGWQDDAIAPAIPEVEAPVDPLAALEARVAALEALAKRKK